jgi:O-antigen/teichoic acid export membrane protein
MVAAMGKTGGSSIASGLISALGTKIVASLLGPGAIAMLGTLQQLRDGAVIAATANGKTALVQGTSSLRGIERREFVRTVALLFAAGTLLVASAICWAPDAAVRWVRLPVASGNMLPWLALTVAVLSLFVFLTSLLNALRDIGRLAWLQLASPAAAALVAWPVAMKVRDGDPLAMVFFLVIPATVTAAMAVIALNRHRFPLREWFLGGGRWWSAGAARHFLSISAAMLASGLVANIALLGVRGLITRRESLAMTGQFDAAWNISMNQVSLILASVQTYYLPVLAASAGANETLRHIRRMLMVATLAVVPGIVALVTLKPLVVAVLYSHAFVGSPEFLRWTLAGDFLKVSAWVLATPMLAARDLTPFLAFDLATHATFFVSAMLLASWVRPGEAAAMGFAISYGLYFALCYGYSRKTSGFRLGGAVGWAWMGGAALVAGASASSWAGTVHPMRAALWVALALGYSGGFALYMRRREA